MLIKLGHRQWACLAAVLIAGCSATRPYPALSLSPSSRLVEPANTVAHSSPGQVQIAGGVQEGKSAPRNVLVLSGGGDSGAYTAGVLKGWTAAGTRPQFDVVTGVSVGALIAPLAFVGTEFDETLSRIATEMRARDVYKLRFPVALLWSDSLADSDPLRRQIEAEITPDMLAKVARAHREGRRLYVGTTDLDTKRLVVWDLGAIAAGDDPQKLDLFRSVLLASASVPGFFAPVPITVNVDGRRYTELHVDGGVSASLFLQPAMLGLGPDGQKPHAGGDTSIYVIVAGKLRQTPKAVQRQLFSVVGESIHGTIQAQFEGDLLKVYLLARLAGAGVALTAVPDDAAVASNPMSFDPDIERKLFEQGYRDGARGLVAHLSSEGLVKMGEPQPPRTGVTFTVEQSRRVDPAAGISAAGTAHAPEQGNDLRALLERAYQDASPTTNPGADSR
jgi:hypothetical protein